MKERKEKKVEKKKEMKEKKKEKKKEREHTLRFQKADHGFEILKAEEELNEGKWEVVKQKMQPLTFLEFKVTINCRF